MEIACSLFVFRTLLKVVALCFAMTPEECKAAIVVAKKGLSDLAALLFEQFTTETDWFDSVEAMHKQVSVETAQNCFVSLQSLLKRIPITRTHKVLREKMLRVALILENVAKTC